LQISPSPTTSLPLRKKSAGAAIFQSFAGAPVRRVNQKGDQACARPALPAIKTGCSTVFYDSLVHLLHFRAVHHGAGNPTRVVSVTGKARLGFSPNTNIIAPVTNGRDAKRAYRVARLKGWEMAPWSILIDSQIDCMDKSKNGVFLWQACVFPRALNIFFPLVSHQNIFFHLFLLVPSSLSSFHHFINLIFNKIMQSSRPFYDESCRPPLITFLILLLHLSSTENPSFLQKKR